MRGAPKHWQDFDVQRCGKVEQAQQIIFGPVFDFALGQLRNFWRYKRPQPFGARPRAGVHPEHAVAGNTVELQLVFFKCLPDEMRPGEFSGLAFEHIIARLRAGRAGFFCKSEKAVESFGTVLRAFDTGVVNGFRHKNL